MLSRHGVEDRPSAPKPRVQWITWNMRPPVMFANVRLFFVVAREADIGGMYETCPSVGWWTAHGVNVSCNRLSFLMRWLNAPYPFCFFFCLRVRRWGCLSRPYDAGLARTRSMCLRMSRGRTVPTQCPHSAHTVPTQCPLEFYGISCMVGLSRLSI